MGFRGLGSGVSGLGSRAFEVSGVGFLTRCFLLRGRSGDWVSSYFREL